MKAESETAADRLLERLADTPLEDWYAAALKAEAATAHVPALPDLWQSAYEADPVRMWTLADNLETLFFRLDSPVAMKRIGGAEGSRALRRATELIAVSLAFPELMTVEQAVALSKPFLELPT